MALRARCAFGGREGGQGGGGGGGGGGAREVQAQAATCIFEDGLSLFVLEEDKWNVQATVRLVWPQRRCNVVGASGTTCLCA
jgi:uncharacterized spore protein YtfJ